MFSFALVFAIKENCVEVFDCIRSSRGSKKKSYQFFFKFIHFVKAKKASAEFNRQIVKNANKRATKTKNRSLYSMIVRKIQLQIRKNKMEKAKSI